jgi:hypothetical protein
MVHIVDDVPELADAAPVLIHALDGFLDAGNAAALATSHLLAGSTGRVVASFDIDAFYDYRARRPTRTTSRPASSSGSTTTRSARRTSCCTVLSPTPTGRLSPRLSSRSWSTSGCA